MTVCLSSGSVGWESQSSFPFLPAFSRTAVKAVAPDAVQFRQITLLLSVPSYPYVAVKKPWIYSRVHVSSRAQGASRLVRSPWQNRQGQSGKTSSHCEAIDLHWWEKDLHFRALLIWVRVCRAVLLFSNFQRKCCRYSMNSIPNFAFVFPYSPSIVVYRQHVWRDARSGTV